MDLVTLFAAAIDTVPTNGPVPPPPPDGGGGGDGSRAFWTNMLSGSVGVVITLLLTGWWNWHDRRETRKAIERDAIFRYMRESLKVAQQLGLHAHSGPIENGRRLSAPSIEAADLVSRSIAELAQLNTELTTIVDDEVVRIAVAHATKGLATLSGTTGGKGFEEYSLFTPTDGHSRQQEIAEHWQAIETAMNGVYAAYANTNSVLSIHVKDKYGSNNGPKSWMRSRWKQLKRKRRETPARDAGPNE